MRNIVKASLALSIAALATSAQAAPPGADFDGMVSEIFVNDTQILVAVSGRVNGSCPGSWGPYNLTFDMADPGADEKFALIRDAFSTGRRIAGFVRGCGSSHIDKLSQVSVY